MKRNRLSSRKRISADATELGRLATCLAESGGKLEDSFWEKQLSDLVDKLLHDGAEDDLNASLDSDISRTLDGHHMGGSECREQGLDLLIGLSLVKAQLQRRKGVSKGGCTGAQQAGAVLVGHQVDLFPELAQRFGKGECSRRAVVFTDHRGADAKAGDQNDAFSSEQLFSRTSQVIDVGKGDKPSLSRIAPCQLVDALDGLGDERSDHDSARSWSRMSVMNM